MGLEKNNLRKHLPPKIWVPVLIVAAVAVAYLVSAKYDDYRQSNPEVCIQVITPARNPKTGEVKNFPTPCDVPERWEKIESEIIDSNY